jgi:hypothetical protein
MTELWLVLFIIAVLIAAAPWWVGLLTTGIARAWHREKWRTLRITDEPLDKVRKGVKRNVVER